jgi:hypothetical protein
MHEVPKPGSNGKPRQSIISLLSELFAGLAMNHGASGSQRQCHSFSNKKSRNFLVIDQKQNIV